MIRRFAAAMGSGVTLVGALVIGWALHQTVWTNEVAITHPVGVLGIGGGVAIVALGVWLEGMFEPSDYVPDEGEDEDEEDEQDEFDEELSPVSEEMLDGREADESYDR